MTVEELDKLIRIEIASDQLSATAHVAAGIPAGALSEQAVLDLVQARGVQVTQDVAARVAALVAAHDPEAREQLSAVIAAGTAPAHGEDGRLEWEPGLDPVSKPQVETGEDGVVDHYRRMTVRSVRAGDRICRIVPATAGVDGCDVTGKTLAAREGKPVSLREDPTIRIDADGVVTAAVAGAVEYRASTLRITGQVTIAGAVDFSTGHVHFRGDVEINDGVRDCFEVHAEGSVRIRGLVEAAHIAAARDVVIQGGMAGRGKGTLRAGRDAEARYLDAARIEVMRDLRVERETINCTVRVGRSFTSENGAVTGGVLVAAGPVVVGQLGNESGVETSVVLGRIEELERLAGLVGEVMPRLSERAARAEEKLEQMRRAAGPSGRRPAQQAEEMTALQFAAEAARAKMRPLERARDRLRKIIDENSCVNLLVRKRLCAGVTLYIGTTVAQMREPIKGPLRIVRDPEKGLLIRDETSGTSVPLGQYARLFEREGYTGPLLSAA